MTNHIAPTGPIDRSEVSEDLRREFAYAVAKPGTKAMLIGPDNENAGSSTIDFCIQQDLAFCVLPRDECLVLDVDREDLFPEALRYYERLHKAGHRPVLLRSGRGRHLFCVVGDQEERKRLRLSAREIGIDPRDSGGDRIRPPFVRHRNALPVQLLAPSSVDEALAALSTKGTEASASPATEARLTQKTWKLLRYGQRGNQSKIVFKIVTGAINVGYPKQKLYRLLLDPQNLGGEGLRSRERQERGREWFEINWRLAQKWVDEHPAIGSRKQAIDALRSVQEEVWHYKWEPVDVPPGPNFKGGRVSGDALRRTLNAFIELALEKGTVNPYASQDELYARAGCDRKITRKALRGLEILGWIKMTKQGRGRKANEYKFLLGQPRKNPPTVITSGGVGSCGGMLVSSTHDLFQRGGGIGQIGWRLVNVLSADQGITVSELSELLPDSPSSIRRSLNTMEELDLTRRDRRHWYLGKDLDFDAAAQKRGTAGRAEVRKVRTQARRERQDVKVEAWRQKKLADEKEQKRKSEGTRLIPALRSGRLPSPDALVRGDHAVDLRTGEILDSRQPTSFEVLTPSRDGHSPMDRDVFSRIASPSSLRRSWEIVRKNKGAAGADWMTVEMVEMLGVDRVVDQLSSELQSSMYEPQPARTVEIPKSSGGLRTLSVLTVRDRIVQGSLKLELEAWWEPSFHSSNYGFRPRRSPKQAVERVAREVAAGKRFLVKSDIVSFFETIDHGRLLQLVEERITDRQVIRLLSQFLTAGVMTSEGVEESECGVPQGGSVSPLLANIYLDGFDHAWGASGLGALIRYVDDFVVVCPSLEEAHEAQRVAAQRMGEIGLALHPDKSRIVDLADEGLDFLGFHLRAHREGDTWLLHRTPSAKSTKRLLGRVTDIIDAGSQDGHEAVVRKLNPVLRGWGHYHASDQAVPTFREIQSTVANRMREHWPEGSDKIYRLDLAA